MACLSSSPPPMMPEDDEEEEDSSLAEGFADLSESDNVPFDLTGKQRRENSKHIFKMTNNFGLKNKMEGSHVGHEPKFCHVCS